MAPALSVVEKKAAELPFLHVYFGGREDLLAWFEKRAAEAGQAPEDHVLWMIEEYKKMMEEG